MTDARLRLFWHRAGPMTAVFGVFAVAAAQGCGGGSTGGTGGTGGTTSTTTTMSSTTTTMSTTTGMGGMTTTTTTTGTGGAPGALTPTLTANQVTPFDVTPDPMAKNLYFTGLSNTAGAAPLAGVYTAATTDTGTTAPTAVLAGAPYVAPFGIAISSDGNTLYVADPGADITLDANGNQIAGGSDLGAIFVQPVAGGAPTQLMGTAGTDPRSVEVNSEGTPAADVVYFTGRNTTTGVVGVYKVAAAGAASATAILEGPPLVDPSGVAVDSEGTVYVADSIGPDGLGQIISIAKGATMGTTLLGGVRIGSPAGLALTLDGKSLLVSSLDPVKATDVILELLIATPAMQTQITMNINANTESAGLHRAHSVDVFGFADGTAGAVGPSGATAAVPGGAVYTVK